MKITNKEMDINKFTIEQQISTFDLINDEILACLNMIEKLISGDKLNSNFENELKHTKPNFYDFHLFAKLLSQRTNLISILNATLLPSREKAYCLFGETNFHFDYDNEIHIWDDGYKLILTKILNNYIDDYLVDYLDKLLISLKYLEKTFLIAEDKLIFIHTTQDNAHIYMKKDEFIDSTFYEDVENEKDIKKKKMLYENQIVKCKLFFNNNGYRYFLESDEDFQKRINMYGNIIFKFENILKIIDEHIAKNNPTSLIEQKVKLPKTNQPQTNLTAEQRRSVIDIPLIYKYNRDKPDYIHNYLSEIKTSFDLTEKGTFGAVCLALHSKKIFIARINFKTLVEILSKYWDIEPPKDKRPNKYTKKRDDLIRKYEILERKIL
jgi:hypothetical protein